MSECVQSGLSAVPRNRSIDARREARLAKFEREKLIVDYLNRGVSIPEIANHMRITEKRMRALIREILARRMPAPPAEFLAMQVSRLNKALLVAYGAMSGLNLQAVDRVVKIVRELDRYHGFAAAERRSLPDASCLEAPGQNPLALVALLANGSELAAQGLEKMGSAPGIDMPPQASNRDDAGAGPAESSALRLEASEQIPLAPAASLSPETAPQSPEKMEYAPGTGMVAEVPDPQHAAV